MIKEKHLFLLAFLILLAVASPQAGNAQQAPVQRANPLDYYNQYQYNPQPQVQPQQVQPQAQPQQQYYQAQPQYQQQAPVAPVPTQPYANPNGYQQPQPIDPYPVPIQPYPTDNDDSYQYDPIYDY